MLADTMRTRRPVADSAITSAGWAETAHAGTDCRDRVKDQTQNATVVQHGMHRGPRDAPQLRPRRRATCTIARPSTCVPGPRRVDYGTRGHHGRRQVATCPVVHTAGAG